MAPIDYDIPFFANSDETHCFQACVKMVLKYFQPDHDYNWDELDKLTAKQPGMWTWAMSGLLWLQQHGFIVQNIEDFDYQRFGNEGADYLYEQWGSEMAKTAIEHSLVEEEIRIAKVFAQQVKTECRLPDISEIPALLHAGYLIIAWVNSRALNDRDGLVGHFVVVKGCTENQFILHDPGNKTGGHPNRHESLAHFTKAWAYPDETAKTLMVIKLA